MYKIIPHTADLRLKVRGKSTNDIFANALLGMSAILKKDFCQKKNKYPIKEKISVSSTDSTTLLIDFLSEVLTASNIKKVVFCQVDFLKFKTNFLEAIIYGVKIDDFAQDIKAVTYHEAQITENKRGELETVIIFDI